MSSVCHIFEEGQFFGCYLLCSTNEKYKGRTYIGFTVNPNRRIKQHNSGYAKGGAKRTSGKGPWEMIMIVHGFPNEISALRFEWAWQNPEKSLRLKHLVPKTKQYNFAFKFNVVSEMLRIGPWCRLPLTIRWLKQEYKRDFLLNKLPPTHMPIVYGLVKIVGKNSKKLNELSSQQLPTASQQSLQCCICSHVISSVDLMLDRLNYLKCINCKVIFHSKCLSSRFLDEKADHNDQLLPIDGDCPQCKRRVMWGELVNYRRSGYKTAFELLDENESDLSDDSNIAL
jgi:structure-specific endonuclease subunit SLX1